MKYFNKIYVKLILSSLVLCSCGGSDDDGSNGGGKVENPEKAVLIFPNNNEECTEGVIISNTQAKLDFDWEKADHATSYTLFVENLIDNTTQELNSNSDNLEVTINRGTPYSWYVVSKASGTETTASSETWKFYLAGEGVENYAPFPADLKSPLNQGAIDGTTVTLEWEGGDVDNDIKEYEVYMDTNTVPTTKLMTTSSETLENQAVDATTTYYWKVVTYDNHGNTSTSQIYSFTTN